MLFSDNVLVRLNCVVASRQAASRGIGMNEYKVEEFAVFLVQNLCVSSVHTNYEMWSKLPWKQVSCVLFLYCL